MSVPVVQPQDCCAPCPSPVVTNVPGPAGSNGSNGSNGVNGVSAFTIVTASYIQPAASSTVNVTVANTGFMSVNMWLFIQTGGYYEVTAINSATSVTVENMGITGNATPGSTIPTNSIVAPTGPQGPAGGSGVSQLNGISPTTTKGDLMVDNGANSPSASVVRLGVGTNGKAVVADSTQATGLNYATITPNSVANSGDIAIFSASSGTPTPVGDSKMQIDATGALRNVNGTPSARGTSAVDLQPVRTNNAHVASGNNAVVGGGQDNTASGANSTVPGGTTNAATSSGDTVGGGSSNTASGGTSVVSGGTGNAASGTSSVVGGGSGNTASQTYATVPGGQNNTASAVGSMAHGVGCTASGSYSEAGGLDALANKFGQRSFANGEFAAQGDCQATDLLMFNSTTNATPTNLFLDGSAARAVIPNNTAWAFDGILIRRQSTGAMRAWTFNGLIKNNAGSVTLVTSNQNALTGDDTNGSFAFSAGGSNDLAIAVTGVAATNYRWAARFRIIEVAY